MENSNDLKKFFNDDTYATGAKCTNCGHAQTVQIKKGTTISNELAATCCDHCGCYTLQKDHSKISPSKKGYYLMQSN